MRLTARSRAGPRRGSRAWPPRPGPRRRQSCWWRSARRRVRGPRGPCRSRRRPRAPGAGRPPPAPRRCASPGVQGVLDQLLERRAGPLDHLAGAIWSRTRGAERRWPRRSPRLDQAHAGAAQRRGGHAQPGTARPPTWVSPAPQAGLPDLRQARRTPRSRPGAPPAPRAQERRGDVRAVGAQGTGAPSSTASPSPRPAPPAAGRGQPAELLGTDRQHFRAGELFRKRTERPGRSVVPASHAQQAGADQHHSLTGPAGASRCRGLFGGGHPRQEARQRFLAEILSSPPGDASLRFGSRRETGSTRRPAAAGLEPCPRPRKLPLRLVSVRKFQDMSACPSERRHRRGLVLRDLEDLVRPSSSKTSRTPSVGLSSTTSPPFSWLSLRAPMNTPRRAGDVVDLGQSTTSL